MSGKYLYRSFKHPNASAQDFRSSQGPKELDVRIGVGAEVLGIFLRLRTRNRYDLDITDDASKALPLTSLLRCQERG